MSSMYDLTVIGGGPGACAAAVYAGRKKLRTLLVTESFGGQSLVSDAIGNWIGEVSVSGVELARKLEAHVRAQETVEVKTPETVRAVVPVRGSCVSGVDWKTVSSVASTDFTEACAWEVQTDKASHQARTVLLASGARRRKLGVPGEDRLNGKGVSYCSTCDAPLFRGKTVAVVGGGNAGLEAVVDLFPYAAKIYLLNLAPELSGDPLTQAEVKKSNKVTVLNNAQTKEIFGDAVVSGLKYEDVQTQHVLDIPVQGVFVEIGSVPNSEMVQGVLTLNPHGEVVVDHRTLATSAPGIFSAGDVTDELYKQNNTAVGDAVSATLSAYNYLLNIQKRSPAAESGIFLPRF